MNRHRPESETPRAATWKLTGEAGTVAMARAHLQGFLAQAAPPLAPGVAYDALVAVSELVGNAVTHAPGPIVLEVSDEGHALDISVADTSSEEPRLRDPDLDGGTGGLGLRVLAAMGAGLDVRHGLDGGKRVTARLSCPGR